MTLTTNKQLDLIQESEIRGFDQLFRSIDDCIMMTLGEPDFAMSDNIKEAAIQAIRENDSHYSHSMGDIGVREAVADFLSKRYGLTYNPETEIIMTIGATEAIFSSLLGILNPGEKVLIPTPTFPLYGIATTIAHGEAVEVNTSETGFLLTADQVHQTMAAHPEIKAIVLNYPSNPTGVTYTREELTSLAEAIKQYDVFVISDEIYSELTYGVEHVSMGTLLPEQTILINGVSKAYAMTGWRVGFMATQAQWIPPLFKAHQSAVTTGVSVSYKAAEEAFRNSASSVDYMRSEYEKRKNVVVKALGELGFSIPEPKGAFYVFAGIPEKFGKDDKEFCRNLATESKVGLIPGSVFGPGGEGYVRISFALGMDNIVEAMKRIKEFVAE